MADSIEAVVFDLGGVLIDWNPLYLYRRLLPDEEAARRFLAEVCTPAWNGQFDAGKPFAEGVAELSAEFPHHGELISAFHTRWPEMLGGAIEGTVAILEELRRAEVALHAISNWSSETFPIAAERYAFLSYFEVLIVSGERKLAKPDPAIFELFLQETGLSATACVFIDDNAENIATASRLGFKAIRFRDPETLRRDLGALGLLSAQSAV
ncbi:HAD family hydrolase [Labrys okinawensis]|uniref:HAD family hydrolase n=1 Tax=Labrys okinawensis TaxID=346911 RepID=UPI001FE06DFB|nr:HAD family phosphatase [Labrys okinawensis]